MILTAIIILLLALLLIVAFLLGRSHLVVALYDCIGEVLGIANAA